MLSDTSIKALNDIGYHIELARQFARGLNREQFLADLKTFYAVTRCLEIISEASRRLSVEIKSRHPDIHWQAMASAGNIYRHEYEDVAANRVWSVMTKELDPLRAAVLSELNV